MLLGTRFPALYGGCADELPVRRAQTPLTSGIQRQFSRPGRKRGQRQSRPVLYPTGSNASLNPSGHRGLLRHSLTAALSVPSFADQQSEVVKNCKKDPNCHVGKKDRTGGVVIIIGGADSIIYCQPGKAGCDIYRPSSSAKIMREVHGLLGASLIQ